MSDTGRGQRVYRMIKQYLTGKGLRFEAHEEDLMIAFPMYGGELPQRVFFRVLDERDMFQVLSVLPDRIPEDRRVDAAVAVAVANYGIVNGSFDLDVTDGEIRFRLAQCYKGLEPGEDLIDYVLGVTVFTTDKYIGLFHKLGSGEMSLEQFLDRESAR